MIGVITDIIQSMGLILWAIMVILMQRRINRLNTRLDLKQITADYEKANKERQESLNPQAICGCRHHQCFHDDNGCGHIETWQHYGSNDPPHLQLCGCKRYTGPEQLPQVIP